MTQHFEVIVIGGGSGGYSAARTARDHGKRVAIVDGSPTLGGLCILRGCMPSKTLIYTAEVLHHARNGSTLGLHIPVAKPDMAQVQARKRSIINDFASYRVEGLESDRFTLFRSHGHFLDESTLQLQDGQVLTAEHFVVATGSTVSWPAIPGFRNCGAWTSDTILDLDFVPPSIIVLGGGVVACELSQYLCRIGSRVTQIQRSPHLLKSEDNDASEVVAQVFRNEGIELFTGTNLLSVEKDGADFTVHFEDDRGGHKTTAPYLLNALGRDPAVADLKLERAGVRQKPNGQIEVNAMQQTSNPRIYAAGDCTGPHEIVHLAVQQGEIAARHLSGRQTKPIEEDHLLLVVFTDPQVARIGPTEHELTARGIPFHRASYPFDDHGKSILMEAKHGFVKVLTDTVSGKLLGAQAVGRDAGELIHSLAVGVVMGATARQLLSVPWYHPTLSEIWTYPLEELAEKESGAGEP